MTDISFDRIVQQSVDPETNITVREMLRGIKRGSTQAEDLARRGIEVMRFYVDTLGLTPSEHPQLRESFDHYWKRFELVQDSAGTIRQYSQRLLTKGGPWR